MADDPTTPSTPPTVPRRSSTEVTSLVLEPPDGGPKQLFVQVAITCPDCGTYTVIFRGHHLKAIRNALIDFIDRDNDLCGPEPQLIRTEGHSGIIPGGNPTNN